MTYNILRSGEDIPLTEAQRELMPFPIPVGRGTIAPQKGAYVRSGPAAKYDSVSGDGYALPFEHEVIVLGRNGDAEDLEYPEWVAVLYRGNINWIYKGGVQLPDGVSWDDLPEIENDAKLDYSEESPLRNIGSWFPILFDAAFRK